ncbi:hypothetical protein N507_1328 [Lacticaseibacillus rhamnosus DSM 14870]|nr:hypothetical protein N507_1328 [Lacticaseibacillus rhamnosus DSM 14870]
MVKAQPSRLSPLTLRFLSGLAHAHHIKNQPHLWLVFERLIS